MTARVFECRRTGRRAVGNNLLFNVRFFHTTVHLEEGLIELKSNIEQRHKSMAKLGIGFDRLANRLIEGAVAEAGLQLNAEDLDQATD